MNTVYDIKVTECPIVVKDSITECWKTVPVSLRKKNTCLNKVFKFYNRSSILL